MRTALILAPLELHFGFESVAQVSNNWHGEFIRLKMKAPVTEWILMARKFKNNQSRAKNLITII